MLRQHFPILKQTMHGKPLVYFDNAATTQKPQCVIDCISDYYENYNANIHRGVHYLSQLATDAYEKSRLQIAQWLNVSEKEIIITKGATESINLIAQSYARTFLKAGDEILISGMEHHANIVPWQLVCQQTGAVLKVIPLNENGQLNLKQFHELLNPKTKLLAVTQMSNALGLINPIADMIKSAHELGAKVLIDGTQGMVHQQNNLKHLDADFYVFSAHKLYGPTGVGILFAKQELLEMMPPYQAGGDMIKSVTFEKTTYNEVPFKFEAGTPNIAGVIGFAKAMQFLQENDFANLLKYEHELFNYAKEKLKVVSGLKFIGESEHQTAIISFVLNHAHPHDIGTILDLEGVAVRTGHHCAMPIMQHFKIPATVRVSLSFYNTFEEVDVLIHALNKVHEVFG